MEDLKKDTTLLYSKLCDCRYNLYKAEDIIVSFQIPYNKERLLNNIIYNHNIIRLSSIIEAVHDICWSRCDDNTEDTLNYGITRDMIPFDELWVKSRISSYPDKWCFWGNEANRMIQGIIDKSEIKPPKDYSYYDKDDNHTYLIIQRKNGFLPMYMKTELLQCYDVIYDYFINLHKYANKYEKLTCKNLIDKNYKDAIKYIKLMIKKIEKAPINKLEQAKKKLEISKIGLDYELLILISEYYSNIKCV